ncbi:MAG: FkbM family methyltransferase [Tetrasphaera sp.]
MSTGAVDQRRRLSAAFRPRNYVALARMLRTFADPADALRRYVTSRGEFPWTARLRTPLGPIALTIPHPHDVRTLNEVFCRQDYGSERPRVVVDIGGNIGLTAVYFLTRRPDSRVYVFEPVPNNLNTLRANVSAFADRCVVSEQAVGVTGGVAEFLVEPVGRYGGLREYTRGDYDFTVISVPCLTIADALRQVLHTEGSIDLVKIDTEGSEEALVAAIPDDVWPRIGEVAYERAGGVVQLASPLRSEGGGRGG